MDPCPTPVCTETVDPVTGAHGITCTSIAFEGCCLAPIPNTSEWGVVCSTTGGAPQAVPAVEPLGLLLAAVLIAAAALWRLR